MNCISPCIVSTLPDEIIKIHSSAFVNNDLKKKFKKKNHTIEIKNSTGPTAVTGKVQTLGDFSLLLQQYYIFCDRSYVYWNYIPFKNQSAKEIWRPCQLESADRLQKAGVLLCRLKYLQLPADPLIPVQSLIQCSGNWRNTLVDPIFSADYIYSFLQYIHYYTPALGNYGINLICWKYSVTLKEKKNQKLKAGLGSETGQMREASKPSHTEKRRSLFISGNLLSLLVSEIVSFIKTQ